MCRHSVRAGAFACEVATRRRWLGANDAQWVAQNLSALRGMAIDVFGEAPAGGGATTALVISEPSAGAALAVLAAAPVASVGRSLSAWREGWWPHSAGAPILLSSRDDEELGRFADQRARIVPIAVELTARDSAPAIRAAHSPHAPGVSRARLWFGAPLQLEPGTASWYAAARARDEIERLLARAA